MKAFRFSFLFILTAMSILALNACTHENKTAAREGFPFAEQTIPAIGNFSGNYLAGRFALRQQDWNAAQSYMNSVLTHDAKNTGLRERTFLLTVGAGNYGKARVLAQDMLKTDAKSEVALTFLASDALQRGDIAKAAAMISSLSEEGFGAYTKPLLAAWTLLAAGSKEEALRLLSDRSTDENATYHIHAGLILEASGDLPGASEHFKSAMASGLSLHSAVIVGNFFARCGQPEISEMIYERLGKMYPFNPFISALMQQDKARLIPPSVLSASEGAGIALYDLATMLYEKHAYDSAQIYASMAQMLLPKSPFVSLLTADIAALRNQYARAVDTYNDIPQDSPIYWLARMRVAEVYEINNRVDLAIDLLTGLSKSPATRVNALATLGDLHRRHKDYPQAVAAYDAALNDMGAITADQWQIVYARGMALESMNDWPRAEKDLLQALEFQPDNAQILNFIGYSWTEKGMNTDRALDYIKRAVAIKPHDGYILDSYGWALYRAGQYENAVKWMENAVAEVPDDAVILDHLGDTYWQVGRHNEARFKWHRAEELSEDAAFRATITRKINAGLPAPAPRVRHGEKEAKL